MPPPEEDKEGLAIIVLKIVGLPMAVIRRRKTAFNSSPCCDLHPVQLIMHLMPSMKPIPSLAVPRVW